MAQSQTKKRVAVILAGCGNRDGAEITESVSALIALGEAGAEYQIFAPDVSFQAINFVTGEKTSEQRNVLVEAARIARGQIQNIRELKATAFDALVMPGGFGVATNLSTWASDGAKCQVHPEVERVINEFYQNEKPICAICIAPALVARVLGKHGVTITSGEAGETAQEMQKTGAHHEICPVDDYITDREHKVISTPAYMYGGAKPFEIFTGVRGAIRETVEMA